MRELIFIDKEKRLKKVCSSVTFWDVLTIYIVEGVKSFSRTLTNASGVRVRQGSGQLNIRLLLTGKVYLALGIPL
jgi:hypothetical protein